MPCVDSKPTDEKENPAEPEENELAVESSYPSASDGCVDMLDTLLGVY